MSVQKVFGVLITVVACLIIGAFVLNVLLPNGVRQAVNGIEGAIYNGTGFNVNLNGDGISGADAGNDQTKNGIVESSEDGNGGASTGERDDKIAGGYTGFNDEN